MSSSRTIQDFEPLASGLDTDPDQWFEKLFVYFLQGYFETENFRGSGMFWTKEEENTEMIITSEKPFLTAVEKTPHISVIVGSSQWGGLGLDQLQKLLQSTGQRTHTDMISLTVAYHCQTKLGTHARRMAWNASLGTNMLRRIIMRQGGLFHVGVNHSRSAETGPTAHTGPLAEEELVSVVVTVPFFWQPQWQIRAPAPVLGKIATSLRLTDPVLNPPRIRGKPASSIPIDRFNNPQSPLEQDVVTED